MATTTAAVAKCEDCGAAFGVLRWRYQCARCKRTLCARCTDHAVLPPDSSGADAMLECCRGCFFALSSLDPTRTFDVAGPAAAAAEEEAEAAPAPPALVFVHGGGGSRMQWGPHFRALSAHFRCVAVDLPGHGARVDAPLTLASAEDAILADMDAALGAGARAVLLGMSLGGYIAMDIVARHAERFAGAVVCSAGQTVGVGRSFAATAGMWFLEATAGAMRHKTLAKALVAQGGERIPKAAIDELLRSGFFFQHTSEMVAIMRASDPLRTLPLYTGPLLFVNGQLDHHDGQERFLQAAQHGKLIVYEGTDHFFASDARFAERFLHDVLAWLRQIGWVGVGMP